MEKPQWIEAIRGETQLLEEMIQHIQSFLSGEEAARTAILSESWYTAWLTRPDLDFFDPDVANKTLQRYHELNRKIQSFKLWLSFRDSPKAEELIVKAMNLGATDLHIRLVFDVLPHVLLESETLVRLSVSCCKIDLRGQKISCSRLKSFSLSQVSIEGNTFWDMISTCPLIEELKLSGCMFREDKVLEPKSRMGEYHFRNLKVLTLEDVEISELHIDVPIIRKFKFSGCDIPSLNLKTTSGEWDSDISIMLKSRLSEISWFLDLREFLHKLSSSKISLNLNTNMIHHDIRNRDIIGLPKPPVVVDSLTLTDALKSRRHHALLDGLFRCCRPSFVNSYLLPSGSMYRHANNRFTRLLCKTKEIGEKQSISALRDLKEVTVKFFKDEGCCPLPYKTMSRASKYSRNTTVKVSLQLKWGGSL
ncbi:hypothetical protein ACS0TY_028958 [Phlomoides rotata]